MKPKNIKEISREDIPLQEYFGENESQRYILMSWEKDDSGNSVAILSMFTRLVVK